MLPERERAICCAQKDKEDAQDSEPPTEPAPLPPAPVPKPSPSEILREAAAKRAAAFVQACTLISVCCITVHNQTIILYGILIQVSSACWAPACDVCGFHLGLLLTQ